MTTTAGTLQRTYIVIALMLSISVSLMCDLSAVAN